MGRFDFFRRWNDKLSQRPVQRSNMSRIEYLLHIIHDQLEAPKEAFGGKNLVQLIEDQLEEGNVDLAIWNISSQVKNCFELANLYWGQGDLVRAEAYMQQTLERHNRLSDAYAQHDMLMQPYHGIECAKSAACLLGIDIENFAGIKMPEIGYEPWFKNVLLSRCLDERDFDMAEWNDAADEWTRRRFPKYRLEEFSVYVKALTGGYASTEVMLSEHEKMFTGRSRQKPNSGLLDGYDDNELIIDFIFAAILKRIGWEGTYRHSWPNTCNVASAPHTVRQPDRYLSIISAAPPSPNSDTGVIEDEQAARRFVDTHVQNQRDDEGNLLDADRPGKERVKIARTLKELGWTRDLATLDLMQAYRVNYILNDRTPITLCDPLEGSSPKLGAWTKLLCDDFGLHPDFIAIAGSEEKTDYRDPQGAWYVYWKMNRKIYAVERDEWDRPEAATKNARLGINLWPSYSSFVAWWVSEHLKSHI
tara:strand:- start:2775 stop:4199 length:1425 start_codon:yes stop_codon:yes gene_type:complete